MFENLLRDNIKRLVFEPSLRKMPNTNRFLFDSLLDANENPFGSPTEQDFNRYASAKTSDTIKSTLQIIKRIAPQNIALSQGTEDALRLILTAFCEPMEDNIIICPPTCKLYERTSLIHNAKVKKVALTPDFQLDIENIAASIDNFTKMIVLNSPNNPTGNSLIFQDIEVILTNFDGIVVLDEAYINFSRQRSFLSSLADYPNLIILQSFSKSWGLAAVPSGMIFAQAGIIDVLEQLQPTHHINATSHDVLLRALQNIDLVNQWTKDLVALRTYLTQRLENLSIIEQVYPSDSNFILVKCRAAYAKKIYQSLVEKSILVKDVSDEIEDCLRITVGTLQENDRLLAALKEI